LTQVADALVPLPGGAAFELPAGMTRQLWITFTPGDRAPGTSRGRLRATSDDGFRSRHSEAIREGVEDFEYLAMLRDRVTLFSRTDPNRAGLSRAIALLDSAAGTVLGAPGATDMEWLSDKDRLSAERVRLAIADLLELLR
jgi:hypothetical protein